MREVIGLRLRKALRGDADLVLAGGQGRKCVPAFLVGASAAIAMAAKLDDCTGHRGARWVRHGSAEGGGLRPGRQAHDERQEQRDRVMAVRLTESIREG